MLNIIILILIILLCVMFFLYMRLNRKYNDLLETTRLRDSVVNNKMTQMSQINNSMEHNKTLLIRERERIDQEIIRLSNQATADDLEEQSSLDDDSISDSVTANPVKVETLYPNMD